MSTEDFGGSDEGSHFMSQERITTSRKFVAMPVDGPKESSGSKYHRTAHDITTGSQASITIDVYAVLLAFDVRDPGLQHAAKKILCAGIRGKASRLQDLREARDALDRAIQEAER